MQSALGKIFSKNYRAAFLTWLAVRFSPSRNATINAIAIDAEFGKPAHRSFTALSHLANQNIFPIKRKLVLTAILANCGDRYVYGGFGAPIVLVLKAPVFLVILVRSDINDDCAGSHLKTCCLD
jgi:hypothetical protein